MKSTPRILHYASKQDYLNRKPKAAVAEKLGEVASSLANKNSVGEDKALSPKKISESAKEKIKDKASEAKSAGKHLLTQAVSSGIKALPVPSLPGIPDISLESTSTKSVSQVKSKEDKPINKPVIMFVKGFEVNPFASDFNSIGTMAQSIPGAKVFDWDDGDEIIATVKKHASDQPVILVGEGMGSDTIVDVANCLNTSEESFRSVDLLVTLNSVGTENDIISSNVKRNVNYISDVDTLFNDGPNIARDKEVTLVENELRSEHPSELGESADIHFNVFQHINDTLFQAVVKKDWQQMQVNAFKDSLKDLGLRPNLFV